MSEVSDLSKNELAVLAEAVDLWEQLLTVLGRVEAYPRDGVLHVETELQPGYLGWIGYNDGGSISFQPAPPDDVAADDSGDQNPSVGIQQTTEGQAS